MFQTISIGLHGVLIVIGVVYSFWHVEELTPPNVTVTFMSAPPPPPPPPPPPKKKGSKKPTEKPKEIVQPTPDQIVQPKEEPEPEPEEYEEEEEEGAVEGGVEGGVAGGVIGGVVGGVVGSTGSDTVKVVPPNIGEKLVLHQVRPTLPPALAKSGMLIFNLIKLCVDKGGTVSSVSLVKGGNKLFDDPCLAALRQWRFKPMSVNGNAVPFCYVQKNILKLQK